MPLNYEYIQYKYCTISSGCLYGVAHIPIRRHIYIQVRPINNGPDPTDTQIQTHQLTNEWSPKLASSFLVEDQVIAVIGGIWQRSRERPPIKQVVFV